MGGILNQFFGYVDKQNIPAEMRGKELRYAVTRAVERDLRLAAAGDRGLADELPDIICEMVVMESFTVNSSYFVPDQVMNDGPSMTTTNGRWGSSKDPECLKTHFVLCSLHNTNNGCLIWMRRDYFTPELVGVWESVVRNAGNSGIQTIVAFVIECLGGKHAEWMAA